MSLDPMPDLATLLRLKQERESRDTREARARPFELDQTTSATPSYPAKPSPAERPPIVWPVRFILPWSHLISDNRKYAPAVRGSRAVLLLKREYREAKRLTALAVQRAIGNAEPVAFPLSLYARVWVPDNRPGHDVANFGKCAHDAMEGLVYVSDEWLWDPHWRRMGTDVDAPRAELTLSPLVP